MPCCFWKTYKLCSPWCRLRFFSRVGDGGKPYQVHMFSVHGLGHAQSMLLIFPICSKSFPNISSTKNVSNLIMPSEWCRVCSWKRLSSEGKIKKIAVVAINAVCCCCFYWDDGTFVFCVVFFLFRSFLTATIAARVLFLIFLVYWQQSSQLSCCVYVCAFAWWWLIG